MVKCAYILIKKKWLVCVLVNSVVCSKTVQKVAEVTLPLGLFPGLLDIASMLLELKMNVPAAIFLFNYCNLVKEQLTYKSIYWGNLQKKKNLRKKLNEVFLLWSVLNSKKTLIFYQ